MKKLFLFILTILSFQSFSQTKDLLYLEGKTMHNKIRLNYILIQQPINQVGYGLEPEMGFVGLNYNVPLNDWL